MRSRDDTLQVKKDIEGSRSRKLAFTAMLIALAMAFSYVESLIPLPVGIPGVKIGLANLVVLVSLYLFGVPYAFAVSLLRIMLTGFLFGSGSAILYSLAGGLLSFAVMLLLKKLSFSCLSVSIAGGVSHNAGQLAAACLVLESARLISYLPVLMLSGFIAGAVIGVISYEVLRRLRPFG